MIVRSINRLPTEQRKRQVLDAALECFLENGYAAATLQQIRLASGASHGSIYHHFGSKQAIALELYEEGRRNYAEHIRVALRRQETAEGAVRMLVAEHLHWTRTHRNWALFLTRIATAEVDDTMRERLIETDAEFAAEVHQWFAPFMQKGMIVRLPPELLVLQLFGPCRAYARLWLAGRASQDIKSAVRLLAEGAWRALSANN
ncbi:MAG: TetR/AcrR family transcriptional regulator [Prosthecobacter sp.]|nr:TetR/AcrR family transcriptional regulator [Prosthecobacter sp.]